MTTQLLNKASQGQEFDKADLALLQTMVAMQDAPEPDPGDKVIQSGEVPMIRTATKSAGYIWLRRNSDGQLKEISKNQLADRLKQKLPNGEPAWLAPNVPWKGRARVPDLVCPLNINHPDRARMDALNLEVCEKRGKLMGQASLRRHLMKKHKDAYEAIQRDEESRKQDRRDAQAAQMSDALTLALQGRTVAVAPRKAAGEASAECDICHLEFTAASPFGLAAKLRAHKKREHSGG